MSVRGAIYPACLMLAHIEVNQWFNCRQRGAVNLKWSWIPAQSPNEGKLRNSRVRISQKHDYNTLSYSIYTNKPRDPVQIVKSKDLMFTLRGEFSFNTVQLTILCTMKVMPLIISTLPQCENKDKTIDAVQTQDWKIKDTVWKHKHIIKIITFVYTFPHIHIV